MNTFFIISGILIVGFVFGLCMAALLTAPFMEDVEDLIQQAENRDASALLDFLETSECNLFYNTTINSWGLVDGKDKLVAAGHSIRAALRRAQDNPLAERVADDFIASEVGITGVA